jgi:hypothetical protein
MSTQVDEVFKLVYRLTQVFIQLQVHIGGVVYQLGTALNSCGLRNYIP